MSRKTWLWILLTVAIIGGLFLLRSINNNQNAKLPSEVAPEALPGTQTNEAPWPAEIHNLRQRLTAIGLPALAEEGSALHIHQHLDIFINGEHFSAPSGVGINEPANFISHIHVHDRASIIHVESPRLQTFYLGQIFDVWGVRFTSECIGGYCEEGDKKLKVFVNGVLNDGDPRLVKLASRQQIVITFGADKDIPNPLPTYSFPPGL